MMRPLFEECVKSGLLEKNVVEQLHTQKEGNNKNIELRTSEEYLSIVRKLYNAIPNYDCKSTKQEQEIKAFLYMIIFTAHRMGEVRKLKKENVVFDENKIISPPEITKTHEYYHFPIPPEYREYFESIESGLLFPTIKRGSTYQIFQRLLKLTDVKFYNGKTLSIHDSRRLMLKVMIVDCGIDSMFADSCLSHKQQSVIKLYLHFSYKDIENAYQKFWGKVRNEESIEEDEITLDDIPREILEMIKQSKKMKKVGLS
jgi:integrase